jgi:hypothetical protein
MYVFFTSRDFRNDAKDEAGSASDDSISGTLGLTASAGATEAVVGAVVAVFDPEGKTFAVLGGEGGSRGFFCAFACTDQPRHVAYRHLSPQAANRNQLPCRSSLDAQPTAPPSPALPLHSQAPAATQPRYLPISSSSIVKAKQRAVVDSPTSASSTLPMPLRDKARRYSAFTFLGEKESAVVQSRSASWYLGPSAVFSSCSLSLSPNAILF